MERRVLLAIFLAFLVLYVWQALFVKPVPKPGTGTTTTAAGNQTAGAPATTTAVAPTPPGAALNAEAPAAPAPAKALVGDSVERDIRVETQSVIAVFTNKGARLKSWRLKRYLDHEKQPQELVELTATHPLPFTLRTPDEAVNTTLNNALFTVSGEPS